MSVPGCCKSVPGRTSPPVTGTDLISGRCCTYLTGVSWFRIRVVRIFTLTPYFLKIVFPDPDNSSPWTLPNSSPPQKQLIQSASFGEAISTAESFLASGPDEDDRIEALYLLAVAQRYGNRP